MQETKLTDIMSLEKWAEIEEEIYKKFKIDTNVFDPNGYRITNVKNWVNPLCRAIKNTDKGQAFICAVAHVNLAKIAQNTGETIIEECDAGIMKIVVPIFYKHSFIGAFGACGLLLEEGEIDSFMINKTTEIEVDKIESLSAGVEKISNKKAEEIADFIKSKIP